MLCSKCGTEVPNGYEFCSNCGYKVETTQMPENERSISKKKKWILLVAAIVCVAALVIVALYFINDAKKKNGLYENIAWGTSYDDVKTMIDKKSGDEKAITVSDKAVIYENFENYRGDKDIEALVIYDCQSDDTLHKVQLLIGNGDGSNYTDEELYDKYANELTKLYGDSEDDKIRQIWTTKNSQIKLFYFSDEIMIISYEDVTMSED